MITVKPTGQSCGATVTGLDLTKPQEASVMHEVRAAWLEHHVLVFPEQAMSNDDLVRFAEYLGPIGDDPYFKPIDGHDRIAAVQRRADETGILFADSWHGDWSFQVRPPSGTCLLGLTIPPVGGDTQFTNQHMALDEMPAAMREKLEGKTGLHSARRAYANDGKYAEKSFDGSMAIRTSDTANAVHGHPLIRSHPETGRLGLFGGSYVFAIEGMPEDEGETLRQEIAQWQACPEFQYRHKWQANMLVLWDNRAVLHKANGGYEGHDRLLHRLTVADDEGYYLQ